MVNKKQQKRKTKKQSAPQAAPNPALVSMRRTPARSSPASTPAPTSNPQRPPRKGRNQSPRAVADAVQKPKKNKPKKDKKQTNQAVRAVEQDFEKGKELYDKYFNFGDISPVEDRYAQDNADLIQLRKDYAMPNDPAFAGRRSADVSDILSRMKGGLDGYTAAENQAIWERSTRDINAQQNQELKNIQDTNAGNMVLGAAATARSDAVRRDAAKQRAQMAQDLAVQNIDEKQRRLNNYRDSVTSAENTEYGRGQDAINAYENTLGGISRADQERQLVNKDLDMANRNAKVAGIGGFADVIGSRRSQRKNEQLFDRFYKREM